MNRKVAGAIVAAAVALASGCGPDSGSPAVRVSSSPPVGPPTIAASAIKSTELAADYYAKAVDPSTLDPMNGWSWATFEQGVQALYDQTGDSKYLKQELAWGKSLSWRLTHSQSDPDSLKAVQTYYDINKINSMASLTAANERMATDLASLPVSQYDWGDALFMGLPNWTRYADTTGNSAYLNKMDALYAWTRDDGGRSSRCAAKPAPSAALFDAAEGLWYRDCRFVGVKDAHGKKVFWARGNGWVIAAMAQVIQTLPAGSSHTAKYLSMFKTMAAKLITLQGSDGMWRSSLEDPSLHATPETSGSALITYALAYGVRAGILSTATYLPHVVKAWNGLTSISLQPSGFLTDCQAVGSAPGPSYTAKNPQTAPTTTSAGTINTDEPPFCAGVFVLAGSAVSALKASPAGH
jgi:rhamnogalacturonyl hydrolase YesR